MANYNSSLPYICSAWFLVGAEMITHFMASSNNYLKLTIEYSRIGSLDFKCQNSRYYSTSFLTKSLRNFP